MEVTKFGCSCEANPLDACSGKRYHSFFVCLKDSKNIEIENIGRKCPGILNPIDLKNI